MSPGAVRSEGSGLGARSDEFVDLRSDLCSMPTDAMWDAMRTAELGWASFGEDTSVNELEHRVAQLLGKETAAWVPTCGMANLVALLALASPGCPAILEECSHILTSEGTWLTTVAGMVPVTLSSDRGRLDPADVEDALRQHNASVLCLENTHTRSGGTVLSVELTDTLAEIAHDHGAFVHLDGARLINASVALGVPLHKLTASVNTVSFSLNKGLCAPIGTVLAGSAPVIAQARSHLRRLGGGTVHKAGIAAAAGLVALETTINGVSNDHRRARTLGELLNEIPGITVSPGTIETNIVLVDVVGSGLTVEAFVDELRGYRVLAMRRDARRIRLVTHRLIGDKDVARTTCAVAAIVERSRRALAMPPGAVGPAA